MKGASFVAATAALASTALATPSKSISERASGSGNKTPQVTVKGNAFWAGNERFYIRGVDYQPGGSGGKADPIADPTGCKRDIEKFTELGINTIRVYMVDNRADHDECMNALAAAGIYLALDVNTPEYSINRADPEISYNNVYLQSLFATVDAFQKYDNTLLFFSGNEVINDDQTTGAAPFVKAVTRDLKQYIGSRGYRKIPVGYSAADVDSNRFEIAQYMNCGTDDERSDFFAFNDYSWCDPSTFQESGWKDKVAKYASYSIPIFLSEYGCNTNTRKFEEVKSLYSSDMSSVYSGGLVYEYSQEDSNYGLVDLSNPRSPKELADFAALKTAYAAAKNPSGDGGYSQSGSPAQCPPKSNTWNVTDNALPAIPTPAMAYMQKGAGQGPGLDGPGSQSAGTGSSGDAEPGSGAVTSTASPDSSQGAAAGLIIPGVDSGVVGMAAIVALSAVFGGVFTLL
ncbi:glycoside hydrolase family 72 protein [Aulographum hederae CBS 113979]|uniref:1,3-beta-glucanosyltransferase n=1 Tax=Aulographum hederae CBS 113979 TaxID=1176131 RepID=A0A6G1GT82_9PEZI|nr:glycoside hydrolase family 72 protein [Aulographum hederae CBS 113979]